MPTFDDRLARHLASLTALLALGAVTGCDARLKRECKTRDGPDGWVVESVAVPVEVGAPCPSVREVEIPDLDCQALISLDHACTFERKDTNQVRVEDGYGGHYVDEGDTPYGYESAFGTVSGPYDVCRYEAVFAQDPDGYVCGRPLRHEGRPLVAPTVPGPTPWSTDDPSPTDLSPSQRAAIAAYWLQAARLEHASVAAFARFTLDLMRLGAPPDLLARTQRAALDEVDHAQRCFALAARYGQPAGPGPLTLPEPTASDRTAIALALFREGCIGETLAVSDAAARLASATDPTVRSTLTAIQRDEATHASLAWDALRWMLRDDDGTLRDQLAQVLAEERTRWLTPSPVPHDGALAAHGLLSDATRLCAFEACFREVIEPTWAALTQPEPVA